MKAGKCPNCGAAITVDESKQTSLCEYCGAAFVTEKAITQINSNTTNQAQVINNYYSTAENVSNVRQPKTQRPVLHIGLAIFLCCFYVFPGIIYIASIKAKQKEWDDKYTY